MNEKNLNIIVNNYIAHYDEILAGDAHSSLWKTVAEFKALADEAMNAADADGFLTGLSALCQAASAQLDSKFVTPMTGIYDLAQKEPETMRRLLAELFADDWGNYSMRESKISAFVEGCSQLRLSYYPGNIRYVMTFGKALSLLALYQPGDNFFYQEAPARLFSECVDFEEEWGIGSEFNYAVYYKMCLELVDFIKRHQLLIFTSCRRYSGESGLYADQEFHLLAYDIIRSNARYKLFDGIRFSAGALLDNKTFKSHQSDAIVCYQKYRNAMERSLMMRKGRSRLASMVTPGMNVSHGRMGDGVIDAYDGEHITVSFGDQGLKRFNLLQSVLGGFIVFEDQRFAQWKEEFESIFRSGEEVQSQVEKAFRELESRIAFLC